MEPYTSKNKTAAKEQLKRRSGEWFKETKTQKLEPTRRRQKKKKSLEWSGAEDQNHVGVKCQKTEKKKKSKPVAVSINKL
jgi:hypothetical protein